jgi:hypothetical protein
MVCEETLWIRQATTMRRMVRASRTVAARKTETVANGLRALERALLRLETARSSEY